MCEIRCDGVMIAFSLLVLLQIENVVGQINEDLVKELYNLYREALSSEHSSSLRRLFKNDKEYKIHVKRLKEVNGYKRHNLMIKEVLRSDTNPLIYINNPVESKLPNAFLSLDEFKRIVTERFEKERDDFNILRNSKLNTVSVNSNPTKTTLSKKVTKLVEKTSVTNTMPLNKNNDEHKTQKVYSTFATTKLNKAETSITNIKPVVIKSKTTEKNSTRTTQTSTLKTKTNTDKTQTSPVHTTLNGIVNKHTSKLNTLSVYSTTDISIKDVINVTTSYGKEIKEELELEEHKDNISQTKTTTFEESSTSESIPDEQLKVVRSSNMTTTELAGQEEIKSEMSTISTQTTTPTTTISKRRTLGRPMVFLGR